MRFKLILLLFVIGVIHISGVSQNDSTLSHEQIQQYSDESILLINYLEGTLNFLGDPDILPSEKDIVFNTSFLKIFVDDEVQIEDDLDENREIPLNKDVQAYLKDIDFFFKKITFSFDIDQIDQLVTDSNVVVFKITLNRHLEGITVENDTVSNTQLRYVEINLNPRENDLKIASIYTTKIREKEELRYWWNNMSSDWKNYFGKSIIVYDTLPLKNVIWFSDSSLVSMKWTQKVMSDTIIVIDDDITDPILFEPDSTLIVYDTVMEIVPDTIAVNTTTIYHLLKTLRKIKRIDLSDNLIFSDLSPISELAELIELNVSNTLIEDLTPIRNLKMLESFNCSGSAVNSIISLRYISTIAEINLSNTLISSVDILSNLKELGKLNISGTSVESLNSLSGLSKLTHLNASSTNISDFSSLKNHLLLSDLNISNTKIQSLSTLDSIKSIQNLNIDSTNISNLSSLENYENLTILQANHTNISDLSPLGNLNQLKVIYCDNSNVKMNEANNFMDKNPGCLVIYNSQNLVNWWEGLSNDWQLVLKKYYKTQAPVTKEILHVLINQNTFSLAYNKSINTLEPLGMLHRLEKLDLQNTLISSLDPVSGLNNLEVININNTKVISLDPLTSLHNLKNVSCENTEISDIMPLLGSHNIDVIYCDNSGIASEHVMLFKSKNSSCLVIYQSEKLRMWWNNLSNPWQEVLGSQLNLPDNPTNEELQELVDLKELVITDNLLIEELSPLHVFTRIEKLTINSTSVVDISPILSLTTLEILDISKNPVYSLGSISNLHKLKKLTLENTSVEDLEPLSELSELIYLNIAGTKIKSLKYLDNLQKIEKLYINNTRVRNIKQLYNLQYLELFQCYNTSIKSSKIEEFKSLKPGIEIIYY
jgi:Leucine-rich repeat (LRR) protein